jgi:hypothetical protein
VWVWVGTEDDEAEQGGKVDPGVEHRQQDGGHGVPQHLCQHKVPAGNIQGTFREHSGNIQGTFREHSGNIQGAFREQHPANMQATYSGNIQGTFIGNIQGTYSGNIQVELKRMPVSLHPNCKTHLKKKYQG